MSILHWFPLLAFLYGAPVFFIRFRYGKAAVASSLPLMVLFDIAVTGTTLAATGTVTADALASAALSGAILALPLAAAAVPGLPRDEWRILLAALASALAWVFLAAATPLGSELDAFLRSFAAEGSLFFSEVFAQAPDSSLILAGFSEESLYGIARKTMLYSVFPAPLVAYAASWRAGRWALERFRPYLIRPFSLKRFENDPLLIIPLLFGMIGIVAHRFVQLPWLEAAAWNALIGSAFLFFLQGAGILRVALARLNRKGRQPLLWVSAGLFLALIAGGGLLLFGLLAVAGAVELFVPLRSRLVDTDLPDPTPGDGDV